MELNSIRNSKSQSNSEMQTPLDFDSFDAFLPHEAIYLEPECYFDTRLLGVNAESTLSAVEDYL